MKRPAPRPALIVQSGFSERDVEILLALLRTGGWATPAAMIRSSLWAMARHMGLDPPIDVLTVEGEQEPKRVRRRKTPPKEDVMDRTKSTPKQLGNEAATELERAIALHGGMASGHEGYSVILEELDELWDEIKKRRSQRDLAAMRKEAIQIAAMALRFVHDVIESGDPK